MSFSLEHDSSDPIALRVLDTIGGCLDYGFQRLFDGIGAVFIGGFAVADYLHPRFEGFLERLLAGIILDKDAIGAILDSDILGSRDREVGSQRVRSAAIVMVKVGVKTMGESETTL